MDRVGGAAAHLVRCDVYLRRYQAPLARELGTRFFLGRTLNAPCLAKYLARKQKKTKKKKKSVHNVSLGRLSTMRPRRVHP